MNSLFREEAVEARRPQTLGTIRLVTPVSQQIWGLVASAVAFAIVLWLCLGHYTQREHVTGSLVPQAGLLTMAATSTGTLTRLAVNTGDHVYRGQTLLIINGDRASAALGDTDAAVGAALQQQAAQLRATLADIPNQSAAQSSDLHTRIEMLTAQIQQTDGQLVLQRKEASMSASFLNKIRPLVERGVISVAQFNAYQSSALSDEAGSKGLERQKLDTAQQRSELKAQLSQLPLETAGKVHELRAQLAQIAVSLAQNAEARDTVLRATTDGQVTSMLVKTGQTVETGEPLLSVLPDGSSLEAQLFVPSSAIGFVHTGTHVILHYQAFPYQKFGIYRGEVIEVSRNALTPAEVNSLLGRQPSSDPLYRVEVRLASQTVQAYGKQQALLPGMVLDADLLLDRRRIIEWIFEPLYGMAMRR